MKLKAKLIRAFMLVIIMPAVAVWLALLLIGLSTPNQEMEFSENPAFWLVTLVAILSLAATVACVVLWLNKVVIRPLRELQKATHEVGDGNLDYELEPLSEDEIGSLVSDFETMRRKLKQNEDDRHAADEEMRIMISNISHDLRTPVTAVKGYSQGILDGVASTPEKLDKYIRTINAKAIDMESLVDQLTIFSRFNTSKIVYSFTKIDLDEYFLEYIDSIRLDLESNNIDLTYTFSPAQKTYIIADGEYFKRVLDNIISNAVKYIDKSRGILVIRIRDIGDMVQIEIEDNGCGIPKRDLPYVFDRFYRTDKSRRSTTGGSGIGLSIVKKIVEDHGGRIWATSMEGVGTMMHMTFRKYEEESR